MKKIIFLLIILATTLSCKAQYNSINTNDLLINNHPVYQVNSNTISENFGEPNETEPYFFEMENTMGELHSYEGIQFYFKDNIVFYFEISNNLFSVLSHNINIGDNISELEAIFPDSYSNRANRELIINIMESDNFISIKYNTSNLITGISLNSY